MCAQRRLRSAWTSAQSDHSPSLSAWRKLGPLATHWAHSEDSDQTGWMPRLIWVFAGRTCHFVGFVTRWLKFINMFFVSSDTDYPNGSTWDEILDRYNLIYCQIIQTFFRPLLNLVSDSKLILNKRGLLKEKACQVVPPHCMSRPKNIHVLQISRPYLGFLSRPWTDQTFYC